MSYYIHDLPGRLRIKTPLLKRNEQAAYDVKKFLGTINGVATIDINPTTGSLLVNYNPRAIRSELIIAELKRKGYFDPELAISN
ncbi:MAG TPA: cation transporter, partial [Dissulfurispiraceae bacterium]|nr:cation transporter [Dissulfurispiraceae bacterium]